METARSRRRGASCPAAWAAYLLLLASCARRGGSSGATAAGDGGPFTTTARSIIEFNECYGCPCCRDGKFPSGEYRWNFECAHCAMNHTLAAYGMSFVRGDELKTNYASEQGFANPV